MRGLERLEAEQPILPTDNSMENSMEINDTEGNDTLVFNRGYREYRGYSSVSYDRYGLQNEQRPGPYDSLTRPNLPFSEVRVFGHLTFFFTF